MQIVIKYHYQISNLPSFPKVSRTQILRERCGLFMRDENKCPNDY